MKNKIAIIVLLISTSAFGQNFEPLELVKRVFTDSIFVVNISQYSIDEYKGNPNVNDVSPDTNLEFLLLAKNEDAAVVNMTVSDTVGFVTDIYLYLRKEGNWKIAALRTLAMTDFIQKMQEECRNMSDKQIDALIEMEEFDSRKDFYRMMEQTDLILESDANIIRHFEENKSAFDSIVKELEAVELNESELDYRSMKLNKYIQTDYGQLLVANVSTSFYCNDCYEFTIGGMVDNEVGYLYIPNMKDVPKMHPSELILLREIGDGWYLFKKT